MSRKSKISFEIEASEKEVYRLLAERDNVSLSVWVRDVLSSAVPTAIRKHLAEGETAASALAAVFKELDRLDRNTNVAPPARPKSVPTRPTAGISSHPCRFLDEELPPNWTKNSCQGTCRSPRKGGPCFCAGEVAKVNCHDFEPKIFPGHGKRR